MNEEALREAARAVRETYDGQSAAAEATRQRVLVGALGARRRRGRAVTWAIAVAATLAISTAWAATTGKLARVAEVVEEAEERWLGRGAPQRRSGGEIGGRSATATASAAETASETASASATETASASATETASASASATETASASASGSVAEHRGGHRHAAPVGSRVDVAADAEEALYAKAHHAHFVEHDSLTAVRAWEAYLAAYPKGRFALEAKYNRALSFVRLGWHDDARAALVPFANGTYGGYRQREASELLEALDNP